MKDIEFSKKIIGIDIYKVKNMYSLQTSQEKYVAKILLYLGIKNTKTMSTLLASYFKFCLVQYLKCEQERKSVFVILVQVL